MTVNLALRVFTLAVSLLLLTLTGCHKAMPRGALVLAQSPRMPVATGASDILDSLYPSGSRVVLWETPFDPKRVRVLSEGLVSAAEPVVSYDGQRVFFAGKARVQGEWQIYQRNLRSGGLELLTSLPGGAMTPALLPDGSLVFASPVPKTFLTNSEQASPALYVQSPGGQPRQLTFSPRGITDPTVLSDGRILCVLAKRAGSSNPESGPALFTLNSDGTEITAFAGPPEATFGIRRPRETGDGRIIYIVSNLDSHVVSGVAESVRKARPFLSRTRVFSELTTTIRSVQPAGNGDLLVCAATTAGSRASPTLLSLFRVNSAAARLGDPFFADPDWNCCDAVELSPHLRPMGRMSSTDLTKHTGHILCLDANFTDDALERPQGTPATSRVRVFAEISPGNVCALGEVPVQADGSFMAEVPADLPLGFEALDENGLVLKSETPTVWVRPGENRACIGCHEPRNCAPRNHRPLAVSVTVPRLTLANARPVQRKTDP